MSETEVLDQLEDVLIEAVVNMFKGTAVEVDRDGAKNIVGKIGTRIMFTAQSMSKEQVDRIILPVKQEK